MYIYLRHQPTRTFPPQNTKKGWLKKKNSKWFEKPTPKPQSPNPLIPNPQPPQPLEPVRLIKVNELDPKVAVEELDGELIAKSLRKNCWQVMRLDVPLEVRING